MNRSGATPRQSDQKLHGLIHQVRARWESFTLDKSTPSVPTPRLSELALRGLQLQQQPFSPPTGEQSYYVDNVFDGLLDAIEESLLQSDHLIILTGEANRGKTCSVAQIINALYEQAQIFMARGSAGQSSEQVIRNMLAAFRSTTPSHVDDCLEQLSGYLSDSENTVGSSLLVLEDADLMDRRELQLLLNHLDHLNESLDGSLKLLFTSAMPAEQLLSGMRSDQINHGQVEEFSQPLLNDEQVVEYIDARLLMAGSDRELPLNERTLRLISETTGGLPGEVDQAAADALNSHFQHRQFAALLSPAHWYAATRKSAKWLLLGGTMLFTGWAMAFFGGDFSLDLEGTTMREIAIPSQQATELQLVAAAVEPTSTEPASLSSTVTTTKQTTTEQSIKKPVLIKPEITKTVVATKVATPEPTVSEPAVIKPPAMVSKPTPVKVVAKPVIVAKPTQKVTVTAPVNADFISGVISGHQWILRRDPARFTAQLSAGWSERALRLFATRNGMTNKTAIYRTERNGKGWFSLIHGDFSSPTEARKAIAKLPKVWRKNSPWIRSFASVQKIIK